MLKFAAALAWGAALMSSAALAQTDTVQTDTVQTDTVQTDTMQTACGNTIIATEPNGAVLRYHFNADRSFDVVLSDGRDAPGAYQIANGRICLTYARAPRR